MQLFLLHSCILKAQIPWLQYRVTSCSHDYFFHLNDILYSTIPIDVTPLPIDVEHPLSLMQCQSGFRSVVVITLASHARGPGFETQRKQLFCP